MAAPAPRAPRSPRDIADALVEPDWGGARVVAALTEDRAALYREGDEVPVPEEMLEALLDGFTALVVAVIEGHVTVVRAADGRRRLPGADQGRAAAAADPAPVPPSAKDDPFIRSRDREVRGSAVHEPVTHRGAGPGRAARVRGHRPAVARRRAARRRPAARAQAPARGHPGRVVPRARVGLRAAVVDHRRWSPGARSGSASSRTARRTAATWRARSIADWAMGQAPDTPVRAAAGARRRAEARPDEATAGPTGSGREPVHREGHQRGEADDDTVIADHEPEAEGPRLAGREGAGRSAADPASAWPITAAPGGPGCRGCPPTMSSCRCPG